MLKYLFFSGLITFSSLCAADAQDIDKQIADLKAKLNQNELQELKKEVKSQDDFIANWPAYGKDVESIRKNEELAEQLRSQIEELERRKQELLSKKSAR